MSIEAVSHREATVIIRPSSGRVVARLGEVWRYRELLYFFVWRDVKVRYKQTVLGAAWAILQPFFTMVVFSIFFGRLANIPSDGIPYPVFSYTALLPWTYFANSLAACSDSLVGAQNLITRAYFPRLLLPLSSVVGGLVDLGIAFVVLVGMIVVYGIAMTWAVVLLPAFVLLALGSALGVGMLMAALNVKYRDVRYVLPFLTQLWLFATPVAYPISIVPEQWRWLYGLNPMVGVVEGFRWALTGTSSPSVVAIASSVVVVLVSLLAGSIYFSRAERTFADVV
jgi:lipopolysaccharide transport system permease protein